MGDYHYSDNPIVEGFFANAGQELERARARFQDFTSDHEGYAILLEEVEELWIQVRKNPSERDPVLIRKELVQIAAMAARFNLDILAQDWKP